VETQELLSLLEASYSRLMAEIEKVGDDRLTVVGVTKTWSLRELLAHLVWWQARLARIVQGQSVEWNPQPTESREAYVNRLNAQAVEEMKAFDVRELLRMFRDSHARMVELARGMTDAQLANQELMTAFRNDTYGHYDEHVPSIRKFAQQRASR
jgi:hypothetical protein